MEPYEELRESRTIGFKTTRQSGKTDWVLEVLATYPAAVAVVTTPLHADDAKSRPTVNEDMANRILTAYEVIPDNYTEKTLALLKAAELIVVDESIFVYGRCNRNKFLKGIVQHIPASSVLIEIN
jgi:GTP-sensing pleiotropic transcriptional regulator CodY